MLLCCEGVFWLSMANKVENPNPFCTHQRDAGPMAASYMAAMVSAFFVWLVWLFVVIVVV
jgi:hypothetical protein